MKKALTTLGIGLWAVLTLIRLCSEPAEGTTFAAWFAGEMAALLSLYLAAKAWSAAERRGLLLTDDDHDQA